MFITKFRRVVKAGFVSFWRSGSVSVASVFVMTVTLFIITGVMFSSALLDTSLSQIRDKVDVNVYFVSNASEQDILSLKKEIDALPEVASTEYISKEKALEIFKNKHSGDQSILQALDELEDNPLRAILTIKAKDPSQYANIAKFLQGDATSAGSDQLIDKTNYFENQTAINRLTKIINAADRMGFVLTLIFIILSVLITFNTIRLAIFTAKDEISVMGLIGASSRYIKGPFVITGIIYGIVAAIITLLILYPITYYVGPFTEDFFVGINLFKYFLGNFVQIASILFLSGICIGAISSYLAVKKYLKV